MTATFKILEMAKKKIGSVARASKLIIENSDK